MGHKMFSLASDAKVHSEGHLFFLVGELDVRVETEKSFKISSTLEWRLLNRGYPNRSFFWSCAESAGRTLEGVDGGRLTFPFSLQSPAQTCNHNSSLLDVLHQYYAHDIQCCVSCVFVRSVVGMAAVIMHQSLESFSESIL